MLRNGDSFLRAMLIMFALIAAFIIVFWADTSWGHLADHQQNAQLTPAQKLWMRSRIFTQQGQQFSCCSSADAELVEETIENGHYRVRSAFTRGEWVDVPDDTVLKEPNLMGHPVVWWYHDGQLKVRCYAPGSGM